MNLIVEEEAPPLVCVFANNLHHALKDPEGLKLVRSLKGVFAIASAKNAQAITYRVRDSEVELCHGVARDAQITITMDFDKPHLKPQIKGLLRHPFMAMRIGKLLEFPLPSWRTSARTFWAYCDGKPFMPKQLIVHCNGDSSSESFGDVESSADDTVEIFAAAATLQNLFVGNSMLTMDVVSGAVQAKGTMAQLAGLSQCGQEIMLGANR